MRLAPLLTIPLLLLSTTTSASIIAPQSVLYEEYVYSSALHAIDNAGMNTPVQEGDGTGGALGVTHVYHGDYQGSYASTAPGGGSADFFEAIAPDDAVEIVLDLTGSGDSPVRAVLFWQYENSGGGANRTGNHARTIDIRINTEAEGSTVFTGPPVTVTLLPVTDGDADDANDLGGLNRAQGFALGELSGRFVQLAITDNYRGHQGISAGGDRVGLGEVRFAREALPDDPSPEKSWLMLVHTHPDDEGIFMGGALPYYAQTLRFPTILVDMTTGWLNDDGSQTGDSQTREAELREAAFRYGLDNEPVFALFQQTNWNLTIDQSWDRWADYITDGDDVDEGKRKASRYLAELIRLHRPEVIATHDFGGEYGHPDHKATAFAVAAAWDLAAGRDAVIDDGVTPPTAISSADLSGEIWEAKKVYIHGYGESQLFHDHWETISIDSDNDGAPDQTPRQAADYALDAHVSQGRPNVVTVYDPLANGGNSWDNYPSEWWGLYASTVGPDSTVADFLVEGSLYSGWARGDFTQHVPDPPATSCSVDLAVLDFGAIAAGDSATAEFTIGNTGSGVLSGTVSLQGENCDGYTIVPGTEFYTLHAGESHDVGVAFRPDQSSLDLDCQVDTGHALCEPVLLSAVVTAAPESGFHGRLDTYPNPFNPRVVVEFGITVGQQVEIAAYDLTGRRVARLAGGLFMPGRHEIVWDGKDARGEPLASGVYFITMHTESTTTTRKVTLLR